MRVPPKDAASPGERLRVLHLITSLEVGGAEVMLERLVAGMATDRYQSVVVSLSGLGPVAQRMIKSGVTVKDLAMRRGRVGPSALIRLVQIIRGYDPDIIQTWLYHADLVGTLATGLTSAKHLIWNIRCTEVDFSRYSPLTGWVVKMLAALSSRPDIIIANSEAGRRSHIRLGYRPDRWKIIPNGFDLARFKPDPAARERLRAMLGIRSGACLIARAARADYMKDHETFLSAAKGFLDAGHQAAFILVGRGAEPSNLTIAASLTRLGLSGVTHALGERSDMPEVLAAMDIVALSSINGEGFPNVLGEAMACGVPCVSTDVGDAAMIIGDTGRVVPPRDPGALAAALAQLASMSSAARSELGRRARERIASNFAIADVVTRYETLYEEIGRMARPHVPAA